MHSWRSPLYLIGILEFWNNYILLLYYYTYTISIYYFLAPIPYIFNQKPPPNLTYSKIPKFQLFVPKHPNFTYPLFGA
jgi:hypothetical protein